MPLSAGVVLLARYCLHALRSRDEPPLNLRLLRARGYATSSALMFASGITLFGAATPNLLLDDGTLADRAHGGHALLVDLVGDDRFVTFAEPYAGRLKLIRGRSPAGAIALLVRPDGFVSWASDDDTPDLGGLEPALLQIMGLRLSA